MKAWPKKPVNTRNMDADHFEAVAYTYEFQRADAAMKRLELAMPLLDEARGGLRDYITDLEKHGASLFYGRDLLKRIEAALAEIGPLP